MMEGELSKSNTRKRVRQTISVPFLWEERPGTPKREWKLSTLPKNPAARPPIKFIASVPFLWEEKPGTPLRSFTQLSPTNIISSMPAPEYLQQNYGSDDDDDDDDEFDGDDEQDEMSESELDDDGGWGSEMDESFNSAPSLLANRLLPTTAISNAIPVLETSFMDRRSGYLQAPSSPAWETDSSTSSYATGETSLVGAPFLERLLPLLTPKSSSFKKVECAENGFSKSSSKAASQDSDLISLTSATIRKPRTLGELIMMSRRRSYQKKAVQLRDQNLSTEFMKGTALGCCIRISGLQEKWKGQLQLKLI